MTKFRKKPVEVEAVRIAEVINNARHGWKHVPVWVRSAYEAGYLVIRPGAVDVRTLEGTMTGYPDDWLILGVEYEMYPCSNSVFQKTYEPA